MDKYYKLDSEKILSNINVYYHDVGRRYTYLINRETELNNAMQDVMHYIEFNDVNVVKGYNLYKQLQDIRIERRIVKDELEEVSIAHEAISKLNTQMSAISKAQSNVRKTKNKISSKTYSPRANKITGITDFQNVQEKYAKKLENLIVYKGGSK